MTPEQQQQSEYYRQYIAPLCIKTKEFIQSLGISKEDSDLVIIQLCHSLFEAESSLAEMLFDEWCNLASNKLNQKVVNQIDS